MYSVLGAGWGCLAGVHGEDVCPGIWGVIVVALARAAEEVRG